MKAIKSKIAPRPSEHRYWIDLSADPDGGVLKFWNGSEWETLTGENVTSDDVTDIQLVSALPANPNTSTLYLIPDE